ncbi:hypothetical protein Back11_27600 [Paenibacillus baekrokdamisoli]|uniref:Uncharacterized protein n=1 Tax=Paenibacillus baekrokdamisoli TaxID=1712516 RepID=A0A3G9IZ31_9BACL|nr:hypothetical protein [Paenibacillus baekrokdamisoli]MBB3070414.1 ABC-type glycerol-3-phosphate transport system substrate-binding protein [Paenibacillus baekrokdamisoli]BBH21415.1 hypothetical protein Back11_27600 [Paenibacillus baekrokdamisoli]
MIIKVFQCILAGFLTLSLSSCGADNGSVKEMDTMSADQNITLEVLNPKVEISTEFEQMVKEYEKENPNVKMNILTFGGRGKLPCRIESKICSK